jgi:diadenosine tetraphosphate (Ap4A) HIT family hydrolase
MPTQLIHTPPDRPVAHCELCENPGGVMVWADAAWRVIRVADADFPAFYRVIAQPHVAEFSDLDEAGRVRCMVLVTTVEQVLRERLRPTKLNLAALGNVVPHLHWHVVARHDWDSHFPQPIWGQRQRELPEPAVGRLACSLPVLDAAVAAALGAISDREPGRPGA